jgi:hypothetical protein
MRKVWGERPRVCFGHVMLANAYWCPGRDGYVSVEIKTDNQVEILIWEISVSGLQDC